MVSSRHPRADLVQPDPRRLERLERTLSTADCELLTRLRSLAVVRASFGEASP
jgi:hypothetical protein